METIEKDPADIEEELLRTEKENEDISTSRGATLLRAQNDKAASISSQEVSLLTSAIVNLTEMLQVKQPSMSGEKGKPDTIRRKGKQSEYTLPAKRAAGLSSGSMSTKVDEDGDCEGLLQHLMYSDAPSDDIDSNELEIQDEMLSQLTNEHESEDSVGDDIETVNWTNWLASCFARKWLTRLCRRKWIAVPRGGFSVSQISHATEVKSYHKHCAIT